MGKVVIKNNPTSFPIFKLLRHQIISQEKNIKFLNMLKSFISLKNYLIEPTKVLNFSRT